jgi:hypothetical protein
MSALPLLFLLIGGFVAVFARRGRLRVSGLNLALVGALLIGLQRLAGPG